MENKKRESNERKSKKKMKKEDAELKNKLKKK